MKILLIAGIVPFRTHGHPGVTAAHIVTHALLSELRKRGHTIALQCIFHQSRVSGALSDGEQAELALLEKQGVDVWPGIFLADHFQRTSERFRSLKMIGNTQNAMAHFYPGYAARDVLRTRVKEAKEAVDVILPLWSPQGVAATHGLAVPRVAYHGDIDYEPSACRLLLDPVLFGSSRHPLHQLDAHLRIYEYKKAHMVLMQGLTGIAHVTARNADFYTKNGHSLSVYVRNTWVDMEQAVITVPADHQPVKIIGHTGYLDKTGGTYGLQFLLKEVLPELEQQMAGRDFELHIIGGGQMMPALRPYADNPRVRMRGFVPDLEAELRNAQVFCVFNNAGRYQAAYTRHLVAWQNGLCLVAHADSKKAIPEILHEQNALLAQTPKQAAEHIVRAVTDHDLNLRLRQKGRETYVQFFRPETIASHLEAILVQAMQNTGTGL